MNAKEISEAQFQLKKLLSQYSTLLNYYQWPYEKQRLVELIFCLMTRLCNRSDEEIRDIINQLNGSGLLNIESLSAIPETKQGIDFSCAKARRITEYLVESGFSEDESKSAVVIMNEVAKGVKEQYGGKIQKFIRKYGLLMLDELSQNFSFSELKKKDVDYAFTYWLQNTLNMPLSLNDNYVKQYCNQHSIKTAQLYSAADELDVNWAIVDDLVRAYIEKQTLAKEESLDNKSSNE